MRGELVTAPRLKNSRIPKAINDIVLKALDPDLKTRYQRASDLMEGVLAARESAPRKAAGTARGTAAASGVAEIQARLRAREAPQPRFCWHCRKPLHARSDRCPFCGEANRRA
jgi:hypothetical protein